MRRGLEKTMKNEQSINETLPGRRQSITETVDGEGFSFSVTVGFHPIYGYPLEVFLTRRGKSGSPLEHTLYEIGVAASKIMQDYDTSSTKILDLEHQLTQAKNQLLHYRQMIGEKE